MRVLRYSQSSVAHAIGIDVGTTKEKVVEKGDGLDVLTAKCPPGKVATGGGYHVGDAGMNEVRGTVPLGPTGAQGWLVRVGKDEDVDFPLDVYVVCVDGSE